MNDADGCHNRKQEWQMSERCKEITDDRNGNIEANDVSLKDASWNDGNALEMVEGPGNAGS